MGYENDRIKRTSRFHCWLVELAECIIIFAFNYRVQTVTLNCIDTITIIME